MSTIDRDALRIGMGLGALIKIQEAVSSAVPGAVPPYGEYPGKDAIRTYAFALAGEAHELADSMGWKPWSTKPRESNERILDEYADILAFVGLLGLYVEKITGCGPIEMAEAYEAKTAVNLARIAGKIEGYGIVKERMDEAENSRTSGEDLKGIDRESSAGLNEEEDLGATDRTVERDPRGEGRAKAASWPEWPQDQLKLF